MKKLLFVAPDHVGIIKIILEQLQENKDYQVDHIDLVPSTSETFRYRNLAHRLQNLYFKKLRKKNLKQEYYKNVILDKIKKTKEQYDVIIVVRPDMMNDEMLQLLRGRTKHFVAHYWDTVSFYPRKLEIRHFFDKIFSFDQNDCREYGFELLPNFYFYTQQEKEIKQQVYGIVTYDQRIADLEKVAAVLGSKAISYRIKAYWSKPFESSYIESITQLLDYKEMLKEISFSNVILDIQKQGQNGLSLRPFEALGLKKKLITNNPVIKEYDFYSPGNICVIDPDNINIPDDFFSTPYQDIDPAILEKYHFRNWFHTLVSSLPANFAVS